MSTLSKKRKNKLEECILSKRNLPRKPGLRDFYGKYIKILPLDIKRDSQQLYQISNGSSIQRSNKYIESYDCNELIWKYTGYNPFLNLNDFTNYLKEVKGMPDTQFFCIFDAIENYQIGVCGYRNNEPEHLKIDIGFVWLSPIAQGTMAATEMGFLLLNHIFELGYRRAHWALFIENIRSWKLATKIGFSFEFIQKKFSVCKNRSWNLTYLKILDHEWPESKRKLQELLYQN